MLEIITGKASKGYEKGENRDRTIKQWINMHK